MSISKQDQKTPTEDAFKIADYVKAVRQPTIIACLEWSVYCNFKAKELPNTQGITKWRQFCFSKVSDVNL